MAYDTNNPFARIVRGELPAFKVLDDEHVLAFMDIMPQAVGHTLVVPKRAGADLLDTPADALQSTILATQRVARAVDAVFSPAGIVITQFNRPAAGQTVFHLHFHVIPVYQAGEWRMHGRDKADFAVLEEQAARLRAALA